MGGFNSDAISNRTIADTLATGVWGAKAQSNFIASKICPVNPFLTQREGKIFLADNKRDVLSAKPTSALEDAPEVSYSENYIEYRRKKYRMKFTINPDNFRKDLVVAKAKLQQEQAGVRVITRKLKVLMESIVANTIFNTTNFVNTNVATLWSNLATANPVSDINAQGNIIKQNRSIKPNIVIMGANAYSNYVSNTNIKNSIRRDEDSLVKIARALDLMKTDNLENLEYLYIADSSFNTANPGQTETRNFIWTPNMVFVGYIEQDPMGEEMTSAVALSASEFKDTLGQPSPIDFRKFREEKNEVGVEMVEGMLDFDLPIIDKLYGRLLTV